MPLEPMSSIRCRRRRANSLAFTSRDLYLSVYFARGGGPQRGEPFERELHADTHVFVDLGEREIGLVLAGRFVVAQPRAADLREIAQDLAERFAVDRGRCRGADAAQEALAPRRERLDLLRERRVVARQQWLEPELRVVEHFCARADYLFEV